MGAKTMLATKLAVNSQAISCTFRPNFSTIMKAAKTTKICRRAPPMKTKRVVEPVARAQHELAALDDPALEARKGQPAPERDGHPDGAADQIERIVAEAQPLRADRNAGIGDQRAERAGRDDPAERLRRPALGQPLELHRLGRRLEIVEAERAEAGRQQQPPEAGEVRHHHGRRAQQQKRQDRQRLLAHEAEQEDDQEGQEPRHLAHGLQPAHVAAVEARHLDGEVVDQHHPGRQRQPDARLHDQQHRLRPAPARQVVDLVDQMIVRDMRAILLPGTYAAGEIRASGFRAGARQITLAFQTATSRGRAGSRRSPPVPCGTPGSARSRRRRPGRRAGRAGKASGRCRG